jgi:hypothetical protein
LQQQKPFETIVYRPRSAQPPATILTLTQLRIMALVLNAATACPILGRRRSRAHYLPQPALLGLTLSHISFERASMQLWCRNSKQRSQLLCCSCPLSILAFRLSRAVNRREGSRSSELRVMARIMRRCYSGFAWRLLR